MFEDILVPVKNRLIDAGKEKFARMFELCFMNTWDTTLRRYENGDTFLISGDIPAMWLRDSSAQVWHYLRYASTHKSIEDMIAGLIRRQLFYISLTPYANAFNYAADGRRLSEDRTNLDKEILPWIWECKYEVDSLCYPIRLAYRFWKTTGNVSWVDETFFQAVRNILAVWKTEQRHGELSPYYFERFNCPPSDTLINNGKGSQTAYTKMTWSGFRPSDDACRYGYLIPSNLFAVKSLEQLGEMLRAFAPDDVERIRDIQTLRNEIHDGIQQYGIVKHDVYGEIFAYETDGLGHYVLMDDANVPSLLGLPYLGLCDVNDPIYRNTRRFVLSKQNPYYYEGVAACGIGSPHTPDSFIWPISLCVQGLTSTDPDEIRAIADTLERTDAGTNLMHESFYKDDPSRFTRTWFAWANSIFSEFLEKYSEQL